MKRLIALAAAALFAAAPAKAETDWPKRDVSVVVPFSAGGTTVMFARIFTNDMQAKYGKPFVVENKTGAGGTVGAAFAAKGDKDGYMLFVGTASTHAIAPFVYKNPRYDAEKDFQPIGLFAKVPGLLVVSNKLPIKTVQELIDYAKAHPGELNFGSSGIGSAPHLPAELFQAMAGVKLNHVPYKASNEVMTALIGGHVDLAFDNITSALPQAKSGTMRALGVTGPERSKSAPEIPAIAETLPGFDAQSWHGLFAPAGTPKPIVDQISADVKRIVALPAVEAKFKEIGAEPAPMTPEEFAKFAAEERVKYRDIVTKAGIVPQ
ncbi:Bug family tripartite tricarboxylate transporter substrate binding protein [Hansschlegelia zhihuaiae]|uniref:Tripartite tricarboxylate transporter substrate binding protein n=1 Tax=Hansschlegelia zhihuaiae TaxID=405005 RepID=A0A4Q0MKL3_9HYPH|nr:tripartite tricarboxylate transporter substrate binding protein [Hansschlegelia zhihuaiae]RXF74138.1 tripartite tricarboxylate transporter substrate binding protein [Hansschlegelia zhihuaiae]